MVVKNKNFLEAAKNVWFPFLFSFVVIFTYGYINQNLPFLGDAYESWEVAKSYFDPNYSFRSYVEYRGFFTFLLFSLFYQISVFLNINDILTFRFFSSMLFAIMTTVSIPYLIGKMLDLKIDVWRKILFTLAVFYFFRGYFLYPSNDYVAFFFLILAVNSVYKSDGKSILMYGLSGFFIACAILSRSNYLISLPFILLWILLRFQEAKLKTFIIARNLFVFCVLFAFMFVANNSINLSRDKTDGFYQSKPVGLVQWQLLNSLNWQKVEWNAGDPDYYGGLIFFDVRGQTIMDNEGLNKEQGGISLSHYVKLILKYPVDFFAIYARHFFSGLDIVYPAIYVTDLHQNRILFSFINYTLIFGALILLIDRFIKSFSVERRKIFLLLTLTTPALAATPFVIEPRFFLPLLLTLYGVIIFGIRLSTNILRISLYSQKFYWLIIAYVFFILVCFTLSANSFEQLEGPLILFNPR